MSATKEHPANTAANSAVDWHRLFADSCALVAPTWPLDQFIAVNPYWEMRSQSIADVAARMAVLGRINLLSPDALASNCHRGEKEMDSARFESAPRSADESEQPGHWLNVSDLLDQRRDLVTRMSWHDEIVEQISRFSARFFSDAANESASPDDFYRAWLDGIRHDAGIAILMGEPAIGEQFRRLPESIEAVFCALSTEVELNPDVAGAYAHALLLDINGWAAWTAYLRWQAGLIGTDNFMTQGLLAVRMAWELLLWRHMLAGDQQAAQQIRFQWRGQQGSLDRLYAEHREAQAADWQSQRSAEARYQHELGRAMLEADMTEQSEPLLQAVFCIDVRSEAFRRQLEAQHPGIQTVGFAGFFGLPIEFRADGAAVARPQLPGLLSPSLSVQASDDPATAGRRRSARWAGVTDAAPAMFGLVESLGLSYAWRLLDRSFLATHRHASRAADLTLNDSRGELDDHAKADLLKGILGAMGLSNAFAPTVLLVGHGSSSCNNPHAASLDCGACGGQSGEVNVRLLSRLLNDNGVRLALAERGVRIPANTQFLPALHDTTLDEVRVLDGSYCPEQVGEWLLDAGVAARRERHHGLQTNDDESIANAALTRAADWSEVRPEWGLAGNAAFVAAPRGRTRHINLRGRVFLHDYEHSKDAEGALLELILTAPMVVANWINMQYNASVADNHHFGSGSKTLHNVVGGRLGVLEGQGGDLRIGLPMQSLHDGRQWMHEPLRLSVYVEAPQAAIDQVYQQHEVVRQLVDNEWLYLFRIEGDAIWQCRDGQWSAAMSRGATA